MHITHFSLQALASIAVFARHAAASTNFSNSSTERLSPIVVDLVPAPGTTPDFKYDFHVIFKDGKCSDSQQAAVLATMKNIAALSDRVQLWQGDGFHDWTGEVTQWFGRSAPTQAAWIKNNFLRVSTAIKHYKSAWIPTYVFVGCDAFDKTSITCMSTDILNIFNDYGYFRRWDTIYWNFCPDFWSLPAAPAKIQSTLDDPKKNIHYMENYLGTREQWLFPGIISIRSIGIKKSNVGVHQTYHNF
ncbi:hypothetical protein HO173_008329 [Letharia columbiana]|uniref:Uncharacterized protein n=1 Tax=Letharia columbiana TaxID=112416 RepID=A0A8H6FRJ9_9LECA|nr:uncharacterized protein HO173_008329 [Letharia columbiana]KAF6233397.1 hypothetical protein HO173_008329 [Letharia columbiana]